MSWAERLRNALAGLGMPCAQGSYGGAETPYFVFNANIIPDNYADNEPQHERILVQLHLFAAMTLDTTTLRKEIKLAVQAAGFSYPSEEDVSDEDGQHVVFELEGVQGV